MVAALCGADDEKIAHHGRGLRRPGLRDAEIGTAEARILQVLLPQCGVGAEGGGDEEVPDAIMTELDALLVARGPAHRAWYKQLAVQQAWEFGGKLSALNQFRSSRRIATAWRPKRSKGKDCPTTSR